MEKISTLASFPSHLYPMSLQPLLSMWKFCMALTLASQEDLLLQVGVTEWWMNQRDT